jgi:hypothetical protein
MNKYNNAYTICQLTKKEIFSNEFAKQEPNHFFASLLTLLIKDEYEGNGCKRVELAIKNSYTLDVQKKIFYTLGLLLKNYN